MTKRLRLVKIVYQAAFVIDDGETLEEATGPQSVLTAADLDGFPDALRDVIAQEELRLNAQADPALNGAKVPS